MQIDPDPGLAQCLEHLAMGAADALGLQAHHVQMPGRLRLLLSLRQGQRQIGQQAVITSRQLPAPGNESVELVQLGQAQGRLQIGDAVIETQLGLLVVPGAVAGLGHLRRVAGHAVAAQAAQMVRQLRAVGQDHAALGAGDDFHRMKAEHRHRREFAAAHRPPGIGRAHRVGGILDQHEAITLRQLRHGAHVAALPGKRHRHHHLGQAARAFGGLELVRQRPGIHVPGVRVDIDEVHLGAAITSAVGRGEEGIGRGPQPVSRPQAGGQAGDVQGRRGIAHRHAMAGLAASGHGLLEAFDGRPLGQPVGPQHRDHRINVRLVETLAPVGNHAGNLACSSAIWPTERKCGLVSERYSNASPTGRPCSPRPSTAKSTLTLVKRIDGWMV